MTKRNKHARTQTLSRDDAQVNTQRLPVDPQTGQPLAPRRQPGYYPGFEVLSQQAFWDEATRNVVLERVQHIPPIRFFTAEEALLMQALCDRLLPQDDRDQAHKIPLVNFIDQRLYERRISGYRFENMPPDHEAHRLGLQGIEAIAQHLYHRNFVQLTPLEQDQVLQTLHDGVPPAGEEIWSKMQVLHYWIFIMQDVVEVYYAHPYAWDEIGYGGPAYPRGYMRLEHGQPEPWEVEEQRYDWNAPSTSLSDTYQPVGGSKGRKLQAYGQRGTH